MSEFEQGDLLKTIDGGSTWRILDGYSRADDWTYRDVHLLAIHPADPNELYLTTGLGVYRSTDAGDTWERRTDNDFRIGYPDHFIVSPQDPDTMFMAGARKHPGLWRTSHSADTTITRTRDRMRSWSDASGGMPGDRRANIEAMSLASYRDGFTLFAGTTDGDVFASENDAEFWNLIGRDLAPISKGDHYHALQRATNR